MSAALFRKTAHEHRWATLITAVTMAAFAIVIVHAFASIPWEMTHVWLEIPWIARLLQALTGARLDEVLSINTLGAFAFVHPFLLAVVWGYIVMSATRTVCGEIDRGTADLLLALPLSRWRVYISVSLWVFLCCPIFMACLWYGIWVGDRTTDLPEDMRIWELRYVVFNACLMHWTVAGISLLFSAAGSRRGRAVGWVFGILVTSFLLNSLAAFWPRAQSLAALGLLHYFQPFAIIRDGAVPTVNIVVLVTLALTTWLSGGIIFARRDIHAT